MTQDSILQCAVYLGLDFPSSINNVIFQNHKTVSENKYAHLIIPDLVPGLEYNLYCITRGFDNVISMSYGRLLESVVVVKMKGVRRLFFDMLTTFVPSDKQSKQVLTMSWQDLPSDDLIIELYTAFGENSSLNSDDNMTLVNYASVFEPKRFVFSRSLKYVSLKASLPKQLRSGKYTLDFVISGLMASQYELVYSTREFVVLDDYMQEAPKLLKCSFSDDGSYIIVKFDMKTDRAKLNKQFTCSKLFSFHDANKASCVWYSSSIIHMQLSVTTSLADDSRSLIVGSTVALVPKKLRAECTSSLGCSSWKTAGLQSIVVSAPDRAVSPVLYVSAPSVIGGCSAFVLDLTSSKGSGGRSWGEVFVTVESDHSHTRGLLNNYFSSTYEVYPPSVVSKNFFAPGYNYTFSIKICNFLLKCSPVVTHVVAVLSGEVPTVSISGLKSRKVFRHHRLFLRANALTSFCGQPTSTKNLVYYWKIFKDGDSTNVTSVSIRPNEFILPPYVLESLSLYNVTVSVWSSISGLSSTAVVEVFVDQSGVEAQVVGGSFQSINFGSSNVLNASTSYDKDIARLTGLNAGLDFQWSCALIEPVVDTTGCGVDLLFKGSRNDEMVQIIANKEEFVNSISEVTVVVFKNSRIDEFVVQLQVLGPKAPIVTIQKLSVGFSSNDKLKLLGNVDLFTANYVTWSAAIDGDEVNLNGVSATTLQLFLPGGKHSMNLILNPQALAVSTMYLFSLQSGDSISTLEVKVDGGPYGGQVVSSPQDGVEYFTNFVVAAKEWTDTNLPLTYEFGFLALDKTYLVLGRRSENTYVTTNFARGNSSDNFRVGIVGIIYNSLDARTSYEQLKIRVSPATVSLNEIEKNIAYSLVSLEGETNIDPIKRVISVYVAPLNAVECTSSPDCSTLWRHDCAEVDNVCGNCFEGYFGDDNSNEPCYLINSHFPTQSPTARPSMSPTSSPSTVPSGAPTCLPSVNSSSNMTLNPSTQPTQLSRRLEVSVFNCTSDSHCGTFYYCDLATAVCKLKQKQCHHSCSRRGLCTFQDVSTGNRMDSCSSQNIRCEAICVCDDLYSGPYCSLNATLRDVKTASRYELIKALQGTLALDNHDARSTETLISTVSSLGKRHHELNLTSCDSLFKIIEYTFALSKTFGVSYNIVEGLLRAVHECSVVYAAAPEESIFVSNRLVLINEYVGLMIDQYSAVVFQDTLVGEGDIQLDLPLFKVVNTIRSVSNNSPVLVSIADTLSQRYDAEYSDVKFTIGRSFPSLQISVYESAQRLLNVNVLSSPFRFSLGFEQPELIEPSGQEISGVAEFKIINSIPQEYGREIVQKNITFRTYCSSRDNFIRHYHCPSGYNITHRCDGRIGTISSGCPRTTWQPLCALIDGSSLLTNPEETQCSRLSFSSTSTTCLCLLPNFNVHSKERTIEVVTVGAYLPSESGLDYYFDEDIVYEEHSLTQSVVVYSLICILGGIIFVILMAISFGVGGDNGAFGKKNVIVDQEYTSATVSPVSNHEKITSVSLIIKEIFPLDTFYPSRHTVQRLCTLILEHHMLTRIFFKQKVKQPNVSERMWMTLHFSTYILFLLFVASFIFETQYPNDKSLCTSKHTVDDCLSVKSVFDEDLSLCHWYLSHHKNEVDVHMCTYKEVELEAMESWLMMLLVSCLMVPFIFVLDYVFDQIILVPTKLDDDGKRIPLKTTVSVLLDRSRTFIRGNIVVPESAKHESSSIEDGINVRETENFASKAFYGNCPSKFSYQEVNDIKTSMSNLLLKLQFQRQYLSNEDEKIFDDNWRWNANDGYFRISKKDAGDEGWFLLPKQKKVDDESSFSIDAGGIVMPFNNVNYLKTQQEFVETLSISKMLNEALRNDATGVEFNKVLLTSFVMDLMGRNNSTTRIFISREKNIFHPKAAVESFYKVVAVVVILGLNSSFLCGVVLRNSDRDSSYQFCFLTFFVVLLLIEMVYYELLICAWMFYYLPFAISNDVQRAMKILHELVVSTFHDRSDIVIFNAAKWFFVSFKLAEKVPHLLVSQVVLSYQTIFRPADQIEQSTSLYRINLASYICALVRMIGTVPFVYQKCLLYFVQLVGLFLFYGLFVLVKQNSLWTILIVLVSGYEMVTCTVINSRKNVVNVDDRESVPRVVDDVEIVVPSLSSIDGDIDKKQDQTGQYNSDDENILVNSVLENSNTVNVVTSEKEIDGQAISNVHDGIISSALCSEREKSDIYSSSLVRPSTVPAIEFSPSVPVTNVVDAKKSLANPPRKIVADIFELSSDSSSDDNESIGQLNEIFDRFLTTGRHQAKKEYDANVTKADDDSDDSMEDYDKLMTQFNFRNMENSESDLSDDID